ncbi:MAG: hypothetical protein JRF72_11025 [Deltaproteobacteria bacterium]|jgi:hypothetical protein|nr:hypothetical protein [Deltaproteobacteria bacterium]
MKRLSKLTGIIIAAGLSIILLSGCISRYDIKVPVSDPMPHPMLAQMQSVSVEEKDRVIYFGESRKYHKRGVTVVVLKGDPYELGYARGVLLKDEIKSWVRDGLYMIKKHAMGTSVGDTLMTSRAKKVEKYIAPEQVEEIRGLSAGSGIEYETHLVWMQII